MAALAAVALAALPAGGIVGGVGAQPAHAAGSVSVTVEGDSSLSAVADPVYQTTLRLNGSGFQSIKNGFGGIYVLFGWVDGDGWQPSAGGVTGTDYRYVPDNETDPVGFASFVTFPGSSTAYAANGGELAEDGTWSTTLTVPGATFTALDRSGTPSEVDCTQVQCGIITIGAHGVKNASNESFTPITFRDLYSGSGDATIAEVPAGAGAIEQIESVGEPSAAATAEPSPEETRYVTEAPDPAQAEAAAQSSAVAELIPVLVWVVVGIGVLAVVAIGVLVWVAVSSRRRRAGSAGGTDA
ncbi:hypothetical protein D9V30_08260 [Mycetocola reblochoni]|uniref:Minor silk ampullate protein n=2 Tax=Mycetocola reblochoni TaxID=331618 RepID=A0A1R4IRB3_9MICO|nr:hypothetical protein D9V30_08260 [Mycetocola reblochoni]SJN22214.1 hypothetical protein FM119_03075 [Mycetocola reblochoni REB411]